MRLIKIECIGEGGLRARPYGVWEIVGIGDDGVFTRLPITPQKSYADANSVGSRGVYAYYLMRSERIYEVLAPRSWSSSDHYYAYLEDGQEVRGTTEDAFRWISDTLG